jgi:hypothetical protein
MINKINPSINNEVSRPCTVDKFIIPDKPYFLFLKIALKMRINAIPPMHIISKTSGVIWFRACMNSLF